MLSDLYKMINAHPTVVSIVLNEADYGQLLADLLGPGVVCNSNELTIRGVVVKQAKTNG